MNNDTVVAEVDDDCVDVDCVDDGCSSADDDVDCASTDGSGFGGVGGGDDDDIFLCVAVTLFFGGGGEENKRIPLLQLLRSFN